MSNGDAPTKREWQQYKHQYLLEVQRSSNEDMDKLFDRANDVGQKITSTLITVAGVALTIAGGILATGDVKLSCFAKIAFAVSVSSLFLSILAGLWSYKSMQNFYLVWARAKHARGGKVEGAKVETFDDLAAFRADLLTIDRSLPESSPKLSGTLQFVLFAFGLLMTVIVVAAILFNF